MSRKTVNVSEVLTEANLQLSRIDATATQEFKEGICKMIENILHASGNYRGFNYIAWLNGGFEQWCKDGEPIDKSKYLDYEYDRFYYKA